MINEERLLKTFLKIAGTDSPSLKEGKVAALIKEIFTDHGIKVKEDDLALKIGGECGNLICHLPSNLEGRKVPGIVFAAHMDTVMPCEGKNIIVDYDEDLIKTDGRTILGGDDVAGISALMEVFISIKEMNMPHGDLWGIFTVGEEIGLYGSKYIDFEACGVRAKHGYVLDSGGYIGTCSIKGPAQSVMKLRFRGKSAHAGIEPEKGVNALTSAAEAVASFEQGRIDEDSTCNVGIISGGSATNIICNIAYVDMEVRSHSDKRLKEIMDDIIEKCALACSKRGGSFSIEIKNTYPAYSVCKESKLIENYQKACGRARVKPVYERTGGGSDANFFNYKGIDTVNISVGISKAHTTEEYLRPSHLNKAAALIYELCWQ